MIEKLRVEKNTVLLVNLDIVIHVLSFKKHSFVK